LMARPCDLYPAFFSPDSLLCDYPYLLPNMVVAGMGFISLTLIIIFLPETLEKIPEDEASISKDVDSNVSLHQAHWRCELNFLCEWFREALERARQLTYMPGVFNALTAYFFLSMFSMVFDEILPLWMLTSRARGGLSFTSKGVGQILIGMSLPLMVFVFGGYPLIASKLSSVSCCKTGLIMASVGAAALCTAPLIMRLDNAWIQTPDTTGVHLSTPLILVISMASSVKMGSSLSFTAISIIINETVENRKRGAVNGLAMTIGSLARSVGPMIGAVVYAWSVNNSLQIFPFNYCFGFLILSLIGFYCAVGIPLTTAASRKDHKDFELVPYKDTPIADAHTPNNLGFKIGSISLGHTNNNIHKSDLEAETSSLLDSKTEP
jgi:hypothetical protein